MKENITLGLLEVKYGDDSNLDKKASDIQHQHARIVHLLKQEGWKIQILPCIIGCGTAIHKNTIKTLKDLGINNHNATNKLMHTIVINTIKYGHALLTTRRQAENINPG